ncbi:MAG TPA: J domain-containing protein [bacterium]|nr:J domain-containing protein [bacterium]
MRPEDNALAARPGLTLSAVKTALREWQGHMRRGAQMPSEEEYAAALALVPILPNPPAYLARTLRALADFCVSQGRLEDAASLFAKVAEGRGKKSELFWRDYAGLLFRLALKRLAAGQVALATAAFQTAADLLRGPADLPEVWVAAWNGYSETALWFERAGDNLPAGLYAEHALAFAARLKAWDRAGSWLRALATAGQHRQGAARALVWLRRMQELRSQGWPEALAGAVQAAVGLAQAESALGRLAGSTAIFSEAEVWLREAGGESPALADLHLAWGLALGADEGRAHLEEARGLRLRLLGASHPRTREAEQALLGLETQAPPPADAGPRDWDGGARFTEAPGDRRGEGAGNLLFENSAAELKRLHRRLVRLCHPDTAPEGEAAAWHELMVKVNLAAEAGDLFVLRTLLRETLARRAADRKTPAKPEAEIRSEGVETWIEEDLKP